jgi:hypothetical protein
MTWRSRRNRDKELAAAIEKLAGTYDREDSYPERAMRLLWLGFARYYRLTARHPLAGGVMSWQDAGTRRAARMVSVAWEARRRKKDQA